MDAEKLEASYNALHGLVDCALSPEEVEKSLNGPWHEMLRRHLEPVAGKKVLEVACGQGSLCLWLNRQGAEVWAGDFAGEAVAQTRRLLAMAGDVPSEAVERVVQADLQRLPFEDNAFDIMISCETLEHLPAPEAGLREIHRVLRPGGRFYLTTENYLNVTGLYRLYKERVCREPWRSGTVLQPIEQFFIAPKLLKTLAAHGFTVRHFDSRGYYLYFPRSPQPLDLTGLNRPGWHRRLFRHLGRHLLVVSEIHK